MPAANPLSKLREPFPVEQVKQRDGAGGKKLDYIPIETVLERLLTVAPDYSWQASLAHLGSDFAVVEGTLTIGDKSAYGIGAYEKGNRRSYDLDMAVKSANSEAMKNAAKNGFGVALELWDEEHRQELEVQRREVVQADDLLTTLKNRVADIAVAQGCERTGPAIAAHFGIDVEQLQNVKELEAIVAQEAGSFT